MFSVALKSMINRTPSARYWCESGHNASSCFFVQEEKETYNMGRVTYHIDFRYSPQSKDILSKGTVHVAIGARLESIYLFKSEFKDQIFNIQSSFNEFKPLQSDNNRIQFTVELAFCKVPELIVRLHAILKDFNEPLFKN